MVACVCVGVYCGIFFVGIPLMMTEIMLGRRAQKSVQRHAATGLGGKCVHPLKYLGAAGMLAGVLILGFYSVIGGWVLSYIAIAMQGTFHNITAAESTHKFETLLNTPYLLIFWHSIFMVMTMGVVARGVSSGLGKSQ